MKQSDEQTVAEAESQIGKEEDVRTPERERAIALV